MRKNQLCMWHMILLSGFSILITACDQTSKIDQSSVDVNRRLTTYKSPTCGCCTNWVAHMESEGFNIDVKEYTHISPIKKRYNISPEYQSCHTSIHEPTNYFFEGHIPAFVIKRFLDRPPENVAGLAIAGMPVGSPGMEYGDTKVPYDVWLVHNDGSTTIYEHIEGQ